MLKLAQREDAVSRGFGLMEWTFDPLEIKNAYFNMERLGAVVRRFVLNFYGVTTSALHGGLPTDRCICEWHVASDRVLARLEGRERQEGEVVARIAVPNDIEEIRRNDPRRAREIQAEVSRQFQANVNAGLAATGVERTAEAGIYLFTRWES
jgi:predicted GNAT superfamily acetyltransferase